MVGESRGILCIFHFGVQYYVSMQAKDHGCSELNWFLLNCYWFTHSHFHGNQTLRSGPWEEGEYLSDRDLPFFRILFSPIFSRKGYKKRAAFLPGGTP